MRTKLPILMTHLFILITVFSNAQNTIVIPEGTTPVMDGIVNSAEWADADSAIITISSGVSCKVLYKHDCSNLNLAYLGHLESMNALFPEVLLDINNSKSASWEADDWWFHVSATDCSNQGAYAVWTNCQLVQPDWIGVQNITSGPPVTDTIEIQIPFSTVNITSTDTIGICFLLTNTFNTWIYWPSTATTTSPATWGTALLSCTSIGINEKEKEIPFSVYINPSGNEIVVEGNENSLLAIDIFDLAGRKIKSTNTGKSQRLTIDVSDLQPGMVLVKLTTTDKKEFVKKLEIIR